MMSSEFVIFVVFSYFFVCVIGARKLDQITNPNFGYDGSVGSGLGGSVMGGGGIPGLGGSIGSPIGGIPGLGGGIGSPIGGIPGLGGGIGSPVGGAPGGTGERRRKSEYDLLRSSQSL